METYPTPQSQLNAILIWKREVMRLIEACSKPQQG